ncbi:MAG: hypothetical protein WDA00_03870 [Eubacteriales bacterium]
MKSVSRILTMLLLCATVFSLCAVAGSGPSSQAADIIDDDEYVVVSEKSYDFEGKTVTTGLAQNTIGYTELRANRPTDKNPRYSPHAISNRFGTDAYVSAYDPETGVNSGFSESNLIYRPRSLFPVYNGNPTPEPEAPDFDFLEFEFDLYLHNITSCWMLRLKNSPDSRLLLIDPDGKVYLRTSTASPYDIITEFDVQIGTIELDSWNTFKVRFVLQEGASGSYDYDVYLNDELLTEEVRGHMFRIPAIPDDAAFTAAATEIIMYLAKPDDKPEAEVAWGVDNILVAAYKYTDEDPDVAADIPAVTEHTDTGFTPVWRSADHSADSIITVKSWGTVINGNNALYVSGLSGLPDDASFLGSFTKDGYSVAINEQGELSLAGVSRITLPLFKEAGNRNLTGSVITSDFKVAFSVYGNPTFTMKLDSTTLASNTALALAADAWHVIEVEVRSGLATVLVDGAPVITDISVTLAAATPNFYIDLTGAVTCKDFTVYEWQTVTTYSIELDGETVFISAERARYYRYAKAQAESEEALKAKDYGTVDRRALRPLGRVQFDTSTYFYNPENKVVVLRWGTTINSGTVTDVTFIGNNLEFDPENPGDNYDVNGVVKRLHTLEDGALITSVTPGNATTAGFQANLRKQDGVRNMETDFVLPYFRFSFSIWYDKVTFSDDPFTFGVSEERTNYFFTITKEEGTKNGLFNITAVTHDELEADLSVPLENGWNRIEMIFVVTSADMPANDPENPDAPDIAGATYEVIYTLNGETIFHNEADDEHGQLFHTVFIPKDPTRGGTYLRGAARIASDASALPHELRCLKVRDFKLEHLYDAVVDVNSYHKGLSAEGNFISMDFGEESAAPDVFVNNAGEVSYVNRNDKLLVTHLQNDTVSEIRIGDGIIDTNAERLALDFYLYHNDAFVQELVVSMGAELLLSISDGLVYDSEGAPLTFLKAEGWDTVAVVFEKDGEDYLLTIYIGGEIVSFRQPTGLSALSYLTLSTLGDTDEYYKIDNIAASYTNIPSCLIYMAPVAYVTGEGAGPISNGLHEQIHVLGTRTDNLPTVGKPGAIFAGWYLDPAYQTLVRFVKPSNWNPVNLYAKYNYLVSYDLGDFELPVGETEPETTAAYGAINLPYIDGVEYWLTTVDGKKIYLRGATSFFVDRAVTFTVIDNTTSANVDFILAAEAIDIGLRYMEIEAALELATELYELADKTDADVIEAYALLAPAQARLDDIEEQALDYLAVYDILADETAAYQARREAYETLTEADPISGKSMRDLTDPTYPGVTAANALIADHLRTLNRALERREDLLLAYNAYKDGDHSTMEKAYSLLLDLYNLKVYIEERSPLTLTFEGVSAIMTEVNGWLNAYNQQAAAHNAELLQAHLLSHGIANAAGANILAVRATLDDIRSKVED